jgi:hypothetical protein
MQLVAIIKGVVIGKLVIVAVTIINHSTGLLVDSHTAPIKK